jgi:putative ABC transport system substrate-binding protein
VFRTLIALALVLSPAVLASPAAAARVVVLTSARVEEYEEAIRGFKGTIPHQIVAVYDMDGDLDRGRSQLAEIESKVKPDLIFAVGIWALQVVVSRPPTGASINVPVEQQIWLFKQLGPQIKRIGVVFNRAKTGYLVRRAQIVAREEGLELVTREINTAKDAIGALESLQDGIDALWLVPDETVLSQTVVQQMLLLSYRRKIPLLGLSDRHAQMGALFALSFASGEDIGRQAGEIAQAILAGRPVTDVPYTHARKLYLTVNLKAAQKLGLEIPPAIRARATNIIE